MSLEIPTLHFCWRRRSRGNFGRYHGDVATISPVIAVYRVRRRSAGYHQEEIVEGMLHSFRAFSTLCSSLTRVTNRSEVEWNSGTEAEGWPDEKNCNATRPLPHDANGKSLQSICFDRAKNRKIPY